MADPCTPTTQFTKYPCDIDSSDELPVATDNVTPVKAEVVNRLREATIAVESELGIQPSGTFTTVRARLDALDNLVSAISGGAGGVSEIREEGTLVDTNVTSLNFRGSSVTAQTTSIDGRVDIIVTGTGGGTIVQVQETKAVNSNGQTAFTLSFTPDDDNAVKMYLNGFKQEHGVDYTVSGTSVTYSDTPSLITSDDVEFWYITDGGTAVLTQIQETVAVTVGGQTSFTLADDPVDGDAVEMYINGQKQQHGAGNDYTVSGNTATYLGSLTLDTADVVEFYYITDGVSSGGGGGGGAESLADTLAAGNVTGGNNLIISAGDSIQSSGTDVVVNDNLVVNGKLTVSGLIDPTGLIYEQASAPTTTATEGAVFVSDGTGGLTADTLYFRQASNGTTTAVAGAGAVAVSETLSETLTLGNTTGTNATTSGSDIIFSGAGTQDGIQIGGVAGTDFTIDFSSTATALGAGITVSAQNAGGTNNGGDVTVNTGDAGTGGTAGSFLVDLGDPNGGTAGTVEFLNNGAGFALFTGAGPFSSTALVFGTSNPLVLVAPDIPVSGDGINLLIGGNAGAGAGDDGGDTTIISGNGNGSGLPGTTTVQTGTAGSTTAGGTLALSSSNGGATSGDGGLITITSGSGIAGTSAGGNINVTSGNGFGSASGGFINITAGSTGSGASADGSDVTISAGDSVATSGTGGNVFVFAGTGNTDDGYVQIHDYVNVSTSANTNVISQFGAAQPGISVDGIISVKADSNTNTERGLIVSQHNEGPQGMRVHFRKSRGSLASPATVQQGDGIGRIEIWGHDGANYIRPAYIDWEVDGSVGSGSIPTEMTIYTGSTSATKRVTFRSDGIFELESGTNIQWLFNASSPTITQETTFGAANANSLTVQAQSNTNAGAFDGGNLILSSGSSDNGDDGYVQLQVGGNTLIDLAPTQGSGDFVILRTFVDMEGNLIRDLQDPILDQDAATKSYVDGVVTSGSTLEQTLTAGNTSGTNATTNGNDIIMSGDGTDQDDIVIGGVAGQAFNVSFQSAGTTNGANINVTGQNASSGGNGGDVVVTAGDEAGAGTAGSITLAAGGAGTGTAGNVIISLFGDSSAYVFSATELNANDNNIVTTGYIDLSDGYVTSGIIRINNENYLTSESSGGTDLQLIGIQSDDVLRIGINNAALSGIQMQSGAGATTSVIIGGSLEYSFSPTQFNAQSNNITTTGYLEVGGTPVATTGSIRLPNGVNSRIIARNSSNTDDISLIQLTATDVINLGESGVDIFINGDSTVITNGDSLRWANSLTAPIIRQDAAPTGNGVAFTVRAQNASEVTSSTTQGGDLILEAGDAIGGGAGDRVGGDIEMRPGIGSTSSGTHTPGVFRITGAGSTIVLDELADHSILQNPGDGMLWVKNDTPNTLIFTDDEGNDFVVGGLSTADDLSTVLRQGNTTGIDVTTDGYDIIFSGDGYGQDSITIGGTEGLDFGISFQSTATATGAGITVSAQNAGGTSNGGDVTINTGDAGTGGIAGDFIVDLGNPNGGTVGNVLFNNNGSAIFGANPAGPFSSTSFFFGTANPLVIVSPDTPSSGAGIDIIFGSGIGAASGDAGGDATLQSGAGNGSGIPGNVTVKAGLAGSTTAGGDIFVTASNGGATSGDGGNVSITAGSAVAGTGGGGDITITAGNESSSGTAGSITLAAGGGGTGTAGNVTISLESEPTAYVFSTTSFNANNNNIITTGYLAVGGTPVATTGGIRLPNGTNSRIIARNNANSDDITLLELTSTNVISLGESGANVFINSDATVFTNGNELRWANSLTAPTIRQDAAPTGNGATFTVRAQNASEVTASTTQGGDLILEAGDAIGSGAGDRIGGDIEMRPGIGSTSSGTHTPGVFRITGAGSTIVLDELTNHSITENPGDGMIWVRNDTPNVLMFTDDAGTDFVISGSGSAGSLSDTLVTGNTTGANATTSGNNIIFSGDGSTQDGIQFGGVSGFDFTMSFASTATATGAGVSISAQNAGGATNNGGDITITAGDEAGAGTAGSITLAAGGAGTGTAGNVTLSLQNEPTAYVFSTTEFNANNNNIVTTGYIDLSDGYVTSGIIRINNENYLTSESSGGTDLQLIGIQSDDVLRIGINNAALSGIQMHSGTGATTSILIGGSLEYSFSSTQFNAQSNNITTTGDVTATNVSASGYIDLTGGTVTSGDIRLPNNFTIRSETDPGGTDVTVITFDSFEDLKLGDGTSVGGIDLLASSEIDFIIGTGGGSVKATLDGSGFKFNNSTSVPTSVSGGGYLFAEGGAGKWLGSSGTETTFGPAEPHCPRCDRDFATEWKSPKYGRLSICMWCLTDTLERAGFGPENYTIVKESA